jgi:hypothetical protein
MTEDTSNVCAVCAEMYHNALRAMIFIPPMTTAMDWFVNDVLQNMRLIKSMLIGGWRHYNVRVRGAGALTYENIPRTSQASSGIAVMTIKYLRICDNCYDYDRKKHVCLIRYTILKDKSRTPMKRKPSDIGCHVFHGA